MKSFYTVVLALMLPVVAAAQTMGAPDSVRVRLVVFQFTTDAKDPAAGKMAAAFSRELTNALVGDPGFHVMSHPNASKDKTRARGDAQYGIVGSLRRQGHKVTVDTRVTGIQELTVIPLDKLEMADSVYTPFQAARIVAGRVRVKLLLGANRKGPGGSSDRPAKR